MWPHGSPGECTDAVVSLPRTWRNSWMRRRELGRSCSLKKWQLKQRSRRWRRRSYSWRTKIPNFWRWEHYARWRCQGTAPKAAGTGSGTFAPAHLCGVTGTRTKLRHWTWVWADIPEGVFHALFPLSRLSQILELEKLFIAAIVLCKQISNASPKARPVVCWIPGLSWKISVHISRHFLLILNTDSHWKWNLYWKQNLK